MHKSSPSKPLHRSAFSNLGRITVTTFPNRKYKKKRKKMVAANSYKYGISFHTTICVCVVYETEWLMKSFLYTTKEQLPHYLEYLFSLDEYIAHFAVSGYKIISWPNNARCIILAHSYHFYIHISFFNEKTFWEMWHISAMDWSSKCMHEKVLSIRYLQINMWAKTVFWYSVLLVL